MEKKHLSGYECAKRKIAKLEIEKAALEQANAKSLLQLRNMDEKLALAKREKMLAIKMRDNICERYVWLYEHAPFWLKWWFKHTFKGAAE